MIAVANDTYYNNFSRFVLNYCPPNKPVNPILYSEWAADPTIVERTPLKILKQTLKSNKLHVHGNKDVAIQRIQRHYTQIKHIIDVQRVFRGFIVRESEKLRGPASKDRSICVNDTEFYTMNPLKDIPREYFFSYRNHTGFVYGFNLFALMMMFKRDRRLINPYNREEIPVNVTTRVFSIYKKTRILYSNISTDCIICE
jgi:hypothetical protein